MSRRVSTRVPKRVSSTPTQQTFAPVPKHSSLVQREINTASHVNGLEGHNTYGSGDAAFNFSNIPVFPPNRAEAHAIPRMWSESGNHHFIESVRPRPIKTNNPWGEISGNDEFRTKPDVAGGGAAAARKTMVASSALQHGPAGEAKLTPSSQCSGSNAVNAEEEREGPIGGDESPTSKSPETSSTTPAPTAPAPAAPRPAAPGPAVPVAPTITSATVKAAPSGAANTRTRVGVGEVVDFTGSAAGTWTASIGTATGANSTMFRWTAPATTSTTTTTITLTVGTQSVTKTMTVVPPNSISMRKASSHTSLVGAGGACMLNEVTFGPSDVSLGAIQWLEVPGPASGISGFFTKYSAATLYHHPNTHYALVNDSNKMHAGPYNSRYDHCAWHSTAGPYSNGAFNWVIPNRYILDGESASSGRHFTDTTQRFTMNAAGTMTITKAGAST